MTNLIYWYGCSEGLASAYSFEKSSKLMSYEDGLKKTEKKLNAFRKKKDEGKPLSKAEANLLDGMEEMENDRKKDPQERSGYIDSNNFMEEYQLQESQRRKRKVSKKKRKVVGANNHARRMITSRTITLEG